ncbi:unnamed protein product, partial [Meganyctiphanes norvegica]
STIFSALKRPDPFHTKKKGPQPALSEEEENAMAELITKMFQVGIPQSDDNIQYAVRHVLNSAGRKNIFRNGNLPGKGWLKTFKDRQPQHVNWKPQKLDSGSANVSWYTIIKWFSQLDQHLKDEGLIPQEFFGEGNADRIISVDRTGASVDYNCISKCLFTKSERCNLTRMGKKEFVITIVTACSASGNFFKPIIILPNGSNFKDKVTWNSWPDLDDSEWTIGSSKNGRMEDCLFFTWLQALNDELVEAQTQKPVLLLLGGLKSHVNLITAEYARNRGIILYAIPPYTSHMLHPLHVGFFSPLEIAYKESVEYFSNPSADLNIESLGPAILKADFPRVFMRAWHKAATPDNAKKGFLESGILPRDLDSFNESFLEEHRHFKDSDPGPPPPPAPPQPSKSYLIGRKLLSEKSLQCIESLLDSKLLLFFRLIKSENQDLDDKVYRIWSCLYDLARTNNIIYDKLIEREYGGACSPPSSTISAPAESQVTHLPPILLQAAPSPPPPSPSTSLLASSIPPPGPSTTPAAISTLSPDVSIPPASSIYPSEASTLPPVVSPPPPVISTLPSVVSTHPLIASPHPAASPLPPVSSTSPASSTLLLAASTHPLAPSALLPDASTPPQAASTPPPVVSTSPASSSPPDSSTPPPMPIPSPPFSPLSDPNASMLVTSTQSFPVDCQTFNYQDPADTVCINSTTFHILKQDTKACTSQLSKSIHDTGSPFQVLKNPSDQIRQNKKIKTLDEETIPLALNATSGTQIRWKYLVAEAIKKTEKDSKEQNHLLLGKKNETQQHKEEQKRKGQSKTKETMRKRRKKSEISIEETETEEEENLKLDSEGVRDREFLNIYASFAQ